MAFPTSDETSPSIVPSNGDLATPDLKDLQHQMGLASGFASLGSAPGWTILPRITGEEEFTDNVLEEAAPRRWDLTTIVAPGVSVLGNSDRAQLRLNYQPELEMHVTTGSENILTQQLNTTGTLTVVPDLFFVDLRAVAGAQATNGGIGGSGGLGASGTGGVTGSSLDQGGAVGDTGLSKQNRTETASFAVAPYLLRQFGDAGTGRLGLSLMRSSSAQITGFAPIPLLSQGSTAQTMSTVEETASFQSGDEFAQLRDTFTGDGRQATGSNTGASASTRDTVSDRLDYQINHSIDVFGSLGWEDISYSGGSSVHINDMTWEVGTELTPDPDSELTLGYGHQNGKDTLTASGHYALTPRTILTANYSNGVGTQLEQVGSQLDEGTVANNGSLVNSQTGGPLFNGNNALGVSSGVFRFSYLTIGATTVLDRDTFRVTVGHSEQTQIGTGVPTRSSGVTNGNGSWTHELTPDLVSTVTAAYSTGSPTAGTNSKSLVLALSLQYILSDTVSTFARYSFYDIRSSTAGQSWYQDLFLVGITKQF